MDAFLMKSETIFNGVLRTLTMNKSYSHNQVSQSNSIELIFPVPPHHHQFLNQPYNNNKGDLQPGRGLNSSNILSPSPLPITSEPNGKKTLLLKLPSYCKKDPDMDINFPIPKTNSTSFRCPNCNQTFTCPITLKVHQQEHVLPNVKQFFPHKPQNPSGNKKSQQNYHHYNNDSSCKGSKMKLLSISFSCLICDETFQSRELLVDHANCHLDGHQCGDKSCQNLYSKRHPYLCPTLNQSAINPPLVLTNSNTISKSDNIKGNSNTGDCNNTSNNGSSSSEKLDNQPKTLQTLLTKIDSSQPLPRTNSSNFLISIQTEQLKFTGPAAGNAQKTKGRKSKDKCKSFTISSSPPHPLTSIKSANSNLGNDTISTNNSNNSPNRRKRFQCKFCQKLLSSKLSHVEHLRVHTGEKPYSCPICGKKYAVRNTYKQHLSAHKILDVDALNNNIKDKDHIIMLNNPHHQQLCNMLVTKQPDSLLQFKCHGCKDSFCSQEKLELHACIKEKCRNSYKDRNRQQKRTKTATLQRTISIGDKMQNNRSLKLKTEKLNGSSGCGSALTEGFRCKICGKTFSRKEWRTRHYLSHAGESCYRCEICGDIFPDEQFYLIHAQIHFKKSLQNCSVCGKNFPGKELYERHSCRFAGVNNSTR